MHKNENIHNALLLDGHYLKCVPLYMLTENLS